MGNMNQALMNNLNVKLNMANQQQMQGKMQNNNLPDNQQHLPQQFQAHPVHPQQLNNLGNFVQMQHMNQNFDSNEKQKRTQQFLQQEKAYNQQISNNTSQDGSNSLSNKEISSQNYGAKPQEPKAMITNLSGLGTSSSEITSNIKDLLGLGGMSFGVGGGNKPGPDFGMLAGLMGGSDKDFPNLTNLAKTEDEINNSTPAQEVFLATDDFPSLGDSIKK